MSCKRMWNTLLGKVYVTIYSSNTKALSDLEDNILKEECAPNDFLLVVILYMCD